VRRTSGLDALRAPRSAYRSQHRAQYRADASFANLRAAQRFALQIEDFDTAFTLVGSLRQYAMRSMR
jgi:hypothetical protein